jgi:hypothetical protein
MAFETGTLRLRGPMLDALARRRPRTRIRDAPANAGQ